MPNKPTIRPTACPFCASERVKSGLGSWPGQIYFDCPDCGAVVTFGGVLSREAATKKYNNRPGSVAVILALAAQLPSGLNDKRSVDKLAAEMEELKTSVSIGDMPGAITEGADVVYYAAKAVEYAARQVGVSVNNLYRAAEAKYRLRARPGNPKSDAEERLAVLESQTVPPQ